MGAHRQNLVDMAGWMAIAEALEAVPSFKFLNGHDDYTAIRTGEIREMNLSGTELGIAVLRYLPRSAGTLTKPILRCPR